MTLIPFGESDYNELLLQAVAVLDQARSSLAINSVIQFLTLIGISASY